MGSRRSEGSIYQRKDGVWRGALSLGYGPNGKPKRKVVRRQTRSAVAQELRKLLLRRDQHRSVSTTRRTVASYLPEWLEVYVKMTNKPLTFNAYQSACNNHLIPMLGKIALDQLTGAQVQACLNELTTTKGLKPKAVKNINNVLKSALTRAMRWQYIDRNVARDATPPKQVRFKATPLTVEQADIVLKHLVETDHRFEALYHIALMMGFRRGELLGLQWSDVSFDENTIHVQHNLLRLKGLGMVLCTPKSEDSAVKVPMPQHCAFALLRRKQQQQRERKAAGETWGGDDSFVFTTVKGKRLDGSDPREELTRILKLCSIPDVRLHDLRHTTASLLLAKRVPMKTIQAIMRRASFAITMELYAHLAPTELVNTAQTMNELFPGLNATPKATLRLTAKVQ